VKVLELVSFAKTIAKRLLRGESRQMYYMGNNIGKSPIMSDGYLKEIQSNIVGLVQIHGMSTIKPTCLPDILLPSFNRDIYQWTSFRDRFASMVDGRVGLSDIDKFYYLVGCCIGEALGAVRGIPVSNKSYQLA